MVSDRSIQTENHLFFWIFFSLFHETPHKKSCPSTFSLKIVGLDSLFHGHWETPCRASLIENMAFIYWGISDLILRAFDNVQQKPTRYLLPGDSVTVCPDVCIKFLTCSPVETDDAQHSQLFLTSWMLFRLLSFPGIWGTSATKQLTHFHPKWVFKLWNKDSMLKKLLQHWQWCFA